MSIFGHDKNDKHEEIPADAAHEPQANQPPAQRADVQPTAGSTMTVTDPEVLRNRFFLLWGA